MDEDQRLTEEEIYLICGEKLTKEYDLTNMYSVLVPAEPRKCPDCGLKHIDENEHLFYTNKYTRCIKCSRKYTNEYARKNREKIKLYYRAYRLKRKEHDNYGDY